MGDIKDKDFVDVEYDIYANDKLVQTTDEKKGKAAKLDIKEYGLQTIIVGKSFILKGMDEHITKNPSGKEYTLNLEAKDAYGLRNKALIKTFPKASFEEQKMRPVVGMTYDFNGTFGTVKSVTGGRVMVDFNNPLAGKVIKLTYTVKKKVDDIAKKLSTILNIVLRIPANMYEIKVEGKEIKLLVPAQLSVMKEMLIKSFEELIDMKGFKVNVETNPNSPKK